MAVAVYGGTSPPSTLVAAVTLEINISEELSQNCNQEAGRIHSLLANAQMLEALFCPLVDPRSTVLDLVPVAVDTRLV